MVTMRTMRWLSSVILIPSSFNTLHALEVLEAIGNAKTAQPTIAFQSAMVRVNLKLCWLIMWPGTVRGLCGSEIPMVRARCRLWPPGMVRGCKWDPSISICLELLLNFFLIDSNLYSTGPCTVRRIPTLTTSSTSPQQQRSIIIILISLIWPELLQTMKAQMWCSQSHPLVTNFWPMGTFHLPLKCSRLPHQVWSDPSLLLFQLKMSCLEILHF